MKKNLKNASKAIALTMIALFITSCDGEDGKDGLGLEGLTKYGSISISLEGTRADGAPFTDSNVFRFTSVEGSDYEDHNSVIKSGTDLEFNVLRFLSAPDDVYQETYLDIDLAVTDAGLPTESISFDYLEIYNYAVIADDLSYFVMDDYHYPSDGTSSGITNLSITNYSFNDATNKLKFDFSFVVDGANNETGNQLTVRGAVDVNVLEEIDGGGFSGGEPGI